MLLYYWLNIDIANALKIKTILKDCRIYLISFIVPIKRNMVVKIEYLEGLECTKFINIYFIIIF